MPDRAAEVVTANENALRFMRRVRWMAAPFTVLQFFLYLPPPGVTVPFDQRRIGLLFAGLIVAVNIAITAAAARRVRWRPGLLLGGLVFDATVVVGFIWLFRFDPTAALWALMVIPVLEASVAYQMVGAMAMWSAMSAFYVLRDWAASRQFPNVSFEVPSLTFRSGIVLIVAVTAGSLARSLTREARAQRQAKVMFEHRAALLHGLAVSSRALFATEARNDIEAVWDAIVQCVVDVGFEGVSICVLDDDNDTYRVACGRGLPEGYVGTRHARDQGMAGIVALEQHTVLTDDYAALAQAVPELEAQFGATIGVPIRRFGGDVAAVLIAGYRRRGRISPVEAEYLELLAVHAGVAVSNAEHTAERARHERQLQRIAYSDSLTQLPNRERFVATLDRAVGDGAAGCDVTVLFFDVDRFKTVNDSLGHNGGDEVLQTMAARIAACTRPGDLLARLSGDEFALLLPDVGAAEVERLVREILAQLGRPLEVAGTTLMVTASIGIATTRGAVVVTPGELLSQADTAMYAAKRAGGGRHRWFGPELQEDAARRLMIRTDLQGALDRGELSIAYQPVFDLPRSQIIGAEALLRWSHPVAGDIPPAEFVPVAEESGLIIEIGRWVLREAAAQVARWERETGIALKLGVNFSARQLADVGLIDDIDGALSAAGLRHQRLAFEMTESVMVDHVDHNVAVLTALHDRGVSLAVDDFGTGYSSLSYLQRFPVDIIKIDRSFVQRLGDSEQAAALPRAIIELARALELSVCAEGIEEQPQLDALLGMGCRFGQGFLMGRPQSGDSLGRLLAVDGRPAVHAGAVAVSPPGSA